MDSHDARDDKDAPATGRYARMPRNEGWGIAAGVVLLAIALTYWAWHTKETTHRSPNDVLAPTSTSTGH